MLKHLYLIFGATFVLGFLTGIVIYLQSHTGREGDGGVEEASKGYVVVANSFTKTGGRTASYRIEEKGTYTYLEKLDNGTDARFEGTLEQTNKKELGAYIQGLDFDAVSRSIFVGTCPIEEGDAAYRYAIEYEGRTYSFDSCKQELESTPLFVLLESYFDALSKAHKSVEAPVVE